MASLSRSAVPQGPRLSRVSMVGLQGDTYGGAGSISGHLFSGNASVIGSGLGRCHGMVFGTGTREMGLLSMSEKDTMQNLNDRLATYLETVRSLGEANGKLEQQIREVYATRALAGRYDLSGYFSAIGELRSQIQDASTRNAQVILQIDNAKLAADDFRVKFESELAGRVGIENDLGGLQKVLDELVLSRASLRVQTESLQEELSYLKKNHEEEVAALKGHLGGTVSVEVDSAPGTDLLKTLAEIRDQYEDVIERNRREAEAWHKEQCEMVTQELATSADAIQGARLKITELRRIVQGLQIELQSLHSTKEALKGTLADTEATYGGELAQLQECVARMEAELVQLRTDAQCQADEHQRLLDLKSRLEMEIATYHGLLEGDGVRSDPKSPGKQTPPEAVSSSSTSRRVKTVIEELLDGKVVSSRTEEVEHPL